MYFVWFISKKNLCKLYELWYYKRNFEKLLNKWIKVLYFFNENKNVRLDISTKTKLDKIGIEILWYNTKDDILNKLNLLWPNIYINTFEEWEIQYVSEIKKKLEQKTSDNTLLFINKFIQRDIIWKKSPETITKYNIIKNINKINTIDINFPIIIKPVWWVQSSWVSKVDNIKELKLNLKNLKKNVFKKLKEKWLNEKSILLEEYIDWNMYTIDYFVNQNQNISSTLPVKILLWTDFNIDDFCNIGRILSNESLKEVNSEKLKTFINKTVKSWWIRNTFVHHEFKINSKWKIKTIETNWRIGWYRLEMYELSNNINLLEFPFKKKNQIYNKIDNNVWVFAIYPKKESVFLKFNENIINKIKELPSFYRIRTNNINRWKKIWLTRNGFSKLWSIVLKNNNDQQFEQDINILKNIYFDIIITK